MNSDGLNSLEYTSKTEVYPGYTKIVAKFVAPVVPKYTVEHCVDRSRNYFKHESLIVSRSKGDMRRSYNKAFGNYNKFHKQNITWKPDVTVLKQIKKGGIFKPEKCQAVTNIAVIGVLDGEVKNKTENSLWVDWMHNSLIRQGVEYQLFMMDRDVCLNFQKMMGPSLFTHFLFTNVGEALVSDNCIEKLVNSHSSSLIFKTRKTVVDLKIGTDFVEDNFCLYQQIDLEKALKIKTPAQQVFCDDEKENNYVISKYFTIINSR